MTTFCRKDGRKAKLHRHSSLVAKFTYSYCCFTNLPPRRRRINLFNVCVSVKLHFPALLQILGDGFWEGFHSAPQGPHRPRLFNGSLSQRAGGDRRTRIYRVTSTRRESSINTEITDYPLLDIELYAMCVQRVHAFYQTYLVKQQTHCEMFSYTEV